MRDYHLSMDKRMFDFEKFYLDIAKWLPPNSRIAEVGVAGGASAIFLAEAICNLNKSFSMHLIDSLAYGREDQLGEILTNVGAANLNGFVKIMPIDSLNASCRFADGHFDFVFLDSSHLYQQTRAEIRLWYRKIKEEGILAGHDFNDKEVNNAVTEVIPKKVTRTDIPDREFVPEQVLHTAETDQGYGIWWLRSKFYVKLN